MTQIPDFNQSPSGAAAPLASGSQSQEQALELLRYQYLLQAQRGRLYPEHIPVIIMEQVLEVGCGSGEWIFDLASSFPELHVYGLDTSESALQRAAVRRNYSNLRNVEFRRFDREQPWPFPDHYLDFIHMRDCSRVFVPTQWPAMLQEGVRVLKPGGWLIAVEMEFAAVSSPAFMSLYFAASKMQSQQGHDMDTTGSSIGLAARLYGMLLQAELEEVSYNLHTIDFGFMGGNTPRILLSAILSHIAAIKALIVQQELLSSIQFDGLIEQANRELQSPHLCGWAMLITAYGKRSDIL